MVVYSERLFDESSGITQRRRRLAFDEVEDFFATYVARKLDFYARFSAEAGTAEAHHYYAATLLTARRSQEAIDHGHRALALDPAFDDTRLTIGMAYESLGQLRLALTNFAWELQMDSTDTEAPYRLGRIHYKLKEYRQALDYLERAKAVAPGPSVDYYHARALQELKSSNGPGQPPRAKPDSQEPP